MKTAPGCDEKMDYENSYIDLVELDKIKIKLIDVCAPYNLFKNFYYDPICDTLKKNLLSEKESTAKKRQKQAFFEIHKKYFKNKDFQNIEELLDIIGKWHLSRIGCEWCGNIENLVIDHKHCVSSIYGNDHLGIYRGQLCKSCNSIESNLKNAKDKEKYLESKEYGPETIKYIINNWYN